MSSTFVSMSYNLWRKNYLRERMAALRSVVETRDPDLLSVQELCEESQMAIDDVLPGHRRVHDPMPGWKLESNIWWRDDIFELEEYGAEPIGHELEAEQHRRLFWVRLRLRDAPQAPALVYATAHLTAQWKDLDQVNPRVAQTKRVVEALERLSPADPCIFTTDMNDVERPVGVMRQAGFIDSFSALAAMSPATHPAAPLFGPEDDASLPVVKKVYDWQFFRGPLRSRCSEVVDYFYAGTAPSDHKPIVAVYTM